MVRFYVCLSPLSLTGCPGGSDGKESACRAGDPGSLSGLWRFPGGGHGNPLQYSCLENPMDRGAWWVTVHGVANSQTQLRVFHFLPVSDIQFMGLCPVKTSAE